MTTLLGPSTGYTDILDAAIHEKLRAEAEEERQGRMRFHPLRPSAAGYCARRLAYNLQEYRGHAYYEKELKTPAVYRLLELGHAVEFSTLRNFQLMKVFQQKYKQQTLSFFVLERGTEDVLRQEIVEGTCDFVLWSPEHKSIGDVKSKKDGWSQVYKSKWDEEIERFAGMSSLLQISETAFYADSLEGFLDELGDDDFLADNLYQLNLYANSAFIRARGIDHAFLYRYNKNDSRHMEIRFRPSVEVAKYVVEKYNEVSVAVDRKDVESVEREFFLGSSRCAFCPYKKPCWGGEDALRAYFNTMPKKTWPTDLSAEDQLTHMIAHYEKAEQVMETMKTLEQRIVKELDTKKIKKVRLPNGNVYETKYLKTPHPHVELRRSKL